MHAFVGNMLEVRRQPPTPNPASTSNLQPAYIFLSETAFDALGPDQRLALQRHAELVPVAIPTIEAVGGGSVRCMLAENFLIRA